MRWALIATVWSVGPGQEQRGASEEEKWGKADDEHAFHMHAFFFFVHATSLYLKRM